MAKEKIILVGAGGHCRSCIDVIEEEGRFEIAGIVERRGGSDEPILGYEIIGYDDDLASLYAQYKYALVTLGHIRNYEGRYRLYEKLKSFGFQFPVIISPKAYVSKSAVIGGGTIVMHHACINTQSRIGANCIVNSKALIEHDVTVGNCTHVSTGVILNGGASVGDKAFIGSGSIIRECGDVPSLSFIKAGSLIKSEKSEACKKEEVMIFNELETSDKDLTMVKKHWENEGSVSLADQNLQRLEREKIIDILKILKPNRLADVGCGDGVDTCEFAQFAQDVTAFDYSSEMLKRARTNLEKCKTVSSINQFDLTADEFDKKFDAVITKRCIINLGNFENQKQAIKKIYDALEPGGYYVMLECSLNGLFNLNRYRSKFGLEEIKEPFHNTYLDLAKLRNFIDPLFEIQSFATFSGYYFLTRVYNQMLDGDNYAKYDATAIEVMQHVDLFASENIGAQFVYVLKKKA